MTVYRKATDMYGATTAFAWHVFEDLMLKVGGIRSSMGLFGNAFNFFLSAFPTYSRKQIGRHYRKVALKILI